MNWVLNLFPAYRDALTEAETLRGEMLAMRSRLSIAETERDEAMQRLVDDRTRMIDFLTRRNMGEGLFSDSPLPEAVTDQTTRVVSVHARKLTSPIAISKFKQNIAQRRSAHAVD